MKKLLPAFAALALVTACSGSEAPPPPANDAEMPDVTNEAANVAEAPPPAPLPTATSANATEAPPARPPEEQVQDDADATGMTARVDRDEADDNAAQPAADDTVVSEEKK